MGRYTCSSQKTGTEVDGFALRTYARIYTESNTSLELIAFFITSLSHATHTCSPLLHYFSSIPHSQPYPLFFVPKGEEEGGLYREGQVGNKQQKCKIKPIKTFAASSINWRMKSSIKSVGTTPRMFKQLSDHHQGRAATSRDFLQGDRTNAIESTRLKAHMVLEKTIINRLVAWSGLNRGTKEFLFSSFDFLFLLFFVFLFFYIMK